MSTVHTETNIAPMKPRKTSIAVQVPAGFEEQFHHVYQAFIDGLYNPPASGQGEQMQEQSLPPSLRRALAENNAKADIEAQGAESLKVLYQVANGDSGQCRFIARFLLGLYNGIRFPFDLTDLRCIDRELYEHCMTVLHMDARVTRQEVHCYFDQGGAKFEQLASDWRLIDHRALQQQLQTYRERFGPLDNEQT